VEILLFRDNKIISVTDYYFDSSPDSLSEVVKLAQNRHGKTRKARLGLGTLKIAQFRERLFRLMDRDKVFLDPNTTLSAVAEKIGCSIDQLTHVVSGEFGANFYSYIDQHRIRHARGLLLQGPDDPEYVFQVSEEAGFRSYDNFERAFIKTFNVTPARFHRDRSS